MEQVCYLLTKLYTQIFSIVLFILLPIYVLLFILPKKEAKTDEKKVWKEPHLIVVHGVQTMCQLKKHFSNCNTSQSIHMHRRNLKPIELHAGKMLYRI